MITAFGPRLWEQGQGKIPNIQYVYLYVHGASSFSLRGCLREIEKSEERFRIFLRRGASHSEELWWDLDRFFGAWKGDDYSRIEAKILANRKRSRSRDVRDLSRKGKLIDEFDILIASTCVATGQPLVTNDSDFDQITKLTKLRY